MLFAKEEGLPPPDEEGLFLPQEESVILRVFSFRKNKVFLVRRRKAFLFRIAEEEGLLFLERTFFLEQGGLLFVFADEESLLQILLPGESPQASSSEGLIHLPEEDALFFVRKQKAFFSQKG